MKIQVRSAGMLAKYLPAGSIKNVVELEVAEAATPLDVIKQLGMPLDGQYFVALNGELVSKEERQRQVADDFPLNTKSVLSPQQHIVGIHLHAPAADV